MSDGEDKAKPAYAGMTPEQIARAKADAPKEAPARLDVSHRTSLDRAPAWHPWAQAALLFLGLPLLVPSLLWMFLFSKRWGRVPLVAIAVDALVLVLVSSQVPRMAFVAVVAVAATAALYVWRSSQGALEGGICLGYSNVVVLTIIAGGTLTMVGGCSVLPMGPLMHTSGLYRSPTKVTTKELAENRIFVPKRVEVKDARVDPGRAFYRLPGPPAWFERMPPEQRSDALEAWVPLEGTRDEVWVVFMGTNLVRMTDTVEGHLVNVLPIDVAALGAAQGLGAAPQQPQARHKKHGQPASAAAPVAPPVARLVLVGAPEEVAERTGRTDETKITFDWKWAWLLAIGLVLVAFALWRSVEEARA